MKVFVLFVDSINKFILLCFLSKIKFKNQKKIIHFLNEVFLFFRERYFFIFFIERWLKKLFEVVDLTKINFFDIEDSSSTPLLKMIKKRILQKSNQIKQIKKEIFRKTKKKIKINQRGTGKVEVEIEEK